MRLLAVVIVAIFNASCATTSSEVEIGAHGAIDFSRLIPVPANSKSLQCVERSEYIWHEAAPGRLVILPRNTARPPERPSAMPSLSEDERLLAVSHSGNGVALTSREIIFLGADARRVRLPPENVGAAMDFVAERDGDVFVGMGLILARLTVDSSAVRVVEWWRPSDCPESSTCSCLDAAARAERARLNPRKQSISEAGVTTTAKRQAHGATR